MLPAIMPQLITAIRVAAGVAWLVVVAAEMIAGRTAWDLQSGMRAMAYELIFWFCNMTVIGSVGAVLDRLLVGLTRMARVRWGHER